MAARAAHKVKKENYEKNSVTDGVERDHNGR